jgi:cell division protease FtsH
MSTENQAEKKDINPGTKPNGQKPNDKKPKFNISWIYGIIAISLFGIMILSPMGGQPIEVTWNRFEQEMLKNHDVLKIEVVNRERADIYIKPEKMNEARYADANKSKKRTFTGANPQYFFTIGSLEVFESRINEATKEFAPNEEISISYVKRQNHMDTIINWVIFPLLLIGVWLFIFRRMTGPNGAGSQIFNIGKSRAKVFDKEAAEVKTDFKDVLVWKK